jgi:hypothetical protein
MKDNPPGHPKADAKDGAMGGRVEAHLVGLVDLIHFVESGKTVRPNACRPSCPLRSRQETTKIHCVACLVAERST